MGAGGVGAATDMHQLLRLEATQVGQQIHLPCSSKLLLGYIGHGCSPLSGMRKVQTFLPAP